MNWSWFASARVSYAAPGSIVYVTLATVDEPETSYAYVVPIAITDPVAPAARTASVAVEVIAEGAVVENVVPGRVCDVVDKTVAVAAVALATFALVAAVDEAAEDEADEDEELDEDESALLSAAFASSELLTPPRPSPRPSEMATMTATRTPPRTNHFFLSLPAPLPVFVLRFPAACCWWYCLSQPPRSPAP